MKPIKVRSDMSEEEVRKLVRRVLEQQTIHGRAVLEFEDVGDAEFFAKAMGAHGGAKAEVLKGTADDPGAIRKHPSASRQRKLEGGHS